MKVSKVGSMQNEKERNNSRKRDFKRAKETRMQKDIKKYQVPQKKKKRYENENMY